MNRYRSMKEALTASLAVLGLCVTLSESALATTTGRVEGRRCGGWGDSLAQGEEVTNRYHYGLRCETSLRMQYEIRDAYHKGIRHIGAAEVVTAGYPVYGVFAPNTSDDPEPYKNPKNWFAPKTAARVNEGCVSQAEGDGLKPKDYEIFQFCASGCYTPEQALLTDPVTGATAQAEKAFVDQVGFLASVGPGSELGSFKLHSVPISRHVADTVAHEQLVYTFETLEGRTLRVTATHPLLTEAGELETASSLKPGRALVKADGSLDPIVRVTQGNYYGKVYNFDVDSDLPMDHLLVAQGLVNGSVSFQEENVREANRRLLRATLAKDVTKHFESQARDAAEGTERN